MMPGIGTYFSSVLVSDSSYFLQRVSVQAAWVSLCQVTSWCVCHFGLTVIGVKDLELSTCANFLAHCKSNPA